jgi:hypothetical protein
MALDWNKSLSFGGSSKKAAEYPTKTIINLNTVTSTAVDPRKAIILGVILAVLVGCFVKFGVMDFYGQVSAKQAELSRQQATLAQVESKLANYDSIKAEYESYGSYLSGSSAAAVDAITVLNLIDQQIMPVAKVTSVTLKDNSLSLSLTNASLSTIGNLVNTLSAQSIVSNVSVSTAATNATAAQDVTATMVITLKQAS